MKNLNTSIVMSAMTLSMISACTHVHDLSAQVETPTKYVSVGDYTGTANERIEAAMAAAAKSEHKTVFFPNGEYLLRRGINLNRGPRTELHLVGESRDGVLLTRTSNTWRPTTTVGIGEMGVSG